MGIKADENGRVSLQQHQGKGNIEIDQAAREATQWLIDGVNQRKIACDWDSVNAAHENSREVLKAHRRKAILLSIGFDPDNVDDSNNAYERWQRNIPVILKDKTRDAMLERTGITMAIKRELLEHKQQQARKAAFTNE